MSFKVYINEGERDQICDWVLKYTDIETGGDLFGLWLDDQTAVVQFVLGPGENSHRTTTSFFQDVDYLRESGEYLTKHHGLCNVGQWHSHHIINLFKPSAGDENTVWSNMPMLGLDRYIVFIANITDKVTINCFLFQIKMGQQLSVKRGEFKYLDGNSPLRLNEKVLQNVYSRAESFNEITTFTQEIKYIRNKDATENLHIYNENETGNYTGKIMMPDVAAVSGGREKIENSCTRERTTVKIIEMEKNKSNTKLSVSVHHNPTTQIPTGVRNHHALQQKFVDYGSQDTKKRFNTTANISSSPIQANQRDPRQNTERNRIRVTEQSTNAARDRSTLGTAASHSSWQSQDNRTTPENDRRGKKENFQGTLKDTQKQQEYQRATPETNTQGMQKQPKYQETTYSKGVEGIKSYNVPTTSQGTERQREHTGTTLSPSVVVAKSYNLQTTSQGTQRHWKHTGTKPTTSGQSAMYHTSKAPKDMQEQREHTETTPTTSDQGKKCYNSPTTPKDVQGQREHTETTPSTTARAPGSCTIDFARTPKGTHKQWEHSGIESTKREQDSKSFPTTAKNKQNERDLKKTALKCPESGNLANTSQNEWERQLNKDSNKECYPITRPMKTGTQPTQTLNVKFVGTEGQLVNVIVHQPAGSSSLNRSSRKRKSGDYDNVKYDIELPQPKSSRPAPDYNLMTSKNNLEIIRETANTPSGTFTQAEEDHHKFKQKEGSHDIEKIGSSWSSLLTTMCCKMRSLTITESEVDEIKKNNEEEGNDIQVSYV